MKKQMILRAILCCSSGILCTNNLSPQTQDEANRTNQGKNGFLIGDVYQPALKTGNCIYLVEEYNLHTIGFESNFSVAMFSKKFGKNYFFYFPLCQGLNQKPRKILTLGKAIRESGSYFVRLQDFVRNFFKGILI